MRQSLMILYWEDDSIYLYQNAGGEKFPFKQIDEKMFVFL